jgi:hypothetical protein
MNISSLALTKITISHPSWTHFFRESGLGGEWMVVFDPPRPLDGVMGRSLWRGGRVLFWTGLWDVVASLNSGIIRSLFHSSIGTAQKDRTGQEAEGKRRVEK